MNKYVGLSEARGTLRRGRPLSAHALTGAGLNKVAFPEGGGAVQVSLRLTEPLTALRCRATDESGQHLASAPLVGQTRQLARLPIPSGPARSIQIHIENSVGETPAGVLDLCVEARPNNEPYALAHWRAGAARWRGDQLEITATGEALASPELKFEEAISGEVSFEAIADTPMVIGLWLRDLDKQTIAAGRYWLADGPVRGVTPFRDLPPGRYGASLVVQNIYGVRPPVLRALDVSLCVQSTPAWQEDQCTYLPHWGKLRRFLHRWCKRSSAFNVFVQAIEFRLNREELLSVPRYMSFCPTGQCNAMCSFCSVTINRTGIIKKQIDNDLIRRFTQPVRRTVAMYGLEGNGEPTLHRGFPDLVRDLTAGPSEAYLITNGSRFSESLLPALMRLESVNVSLNAATAETHRAVMKLKEHDIVVGGLKRIVQVRGFKDPSLQVPANPRVSVSFVVTRHNAHEVERFLAQAEEEIGADVALIRPLSELGNELGNVEDLRDIVPLASDVADLIDAVETYKACRRRKLDIRFDREAFKSVRPDPIGHAARPSGYENRLLAPWPKYWRASGGAVTATWLSPRLHLVGGAADDAPWEFESELIPVIAREQLQLRTLVNVSKGAVELAVEGETPDDVLARHTFACGDDGALAAPIQTGARKGVRLRLRVAGEIDAEIDFERLHTPTVPPDSAENVLRAVRWELGLGSVKADTGPGRASVSYTGAAGPYLLKSYAVPTEPGSRVRVRFGADVRTGELGVGLLSGDQSRWLVTATARNGVVELEALTGQDQAFRVAVFAAKDGAVDATLDLTGANLACEALGDAEGLPAPAPIESISTSVAEAAPLDAPPAIAEPGPVELRLIKLDKSEGKQRKYFCHKPWTDLHNFTVDGRMDVCCIATGASQERYSLGNLSAQHFQDVWNGATARLFRRTVNSDEVLPPCARCPMGYSYQGMWFDKAHTLTKISEWLRDRPAFKNPIVRPVFRFAAPLLNRAVTFTFKRFR